VIILLVWVRLCIVYIMFYYGLEYPIVGKLILEKKSEFLIKCLAFVVLLYYYFFKTPTYISSICMLDSVFTLLSLQHVVCIYSWSICYLTKLHCATYIF
jgi:hypothetical protein